MAIIIKEIKVVTTVEKSRVAQMELSPELINQIRKLIREEKLQQVQTYQKSER